MHASMKAFNMDASFTGKESGLYVRSSRHNCVNTLKLDLMPKEINLREVGGRQNSPFLRNRFNRTRITTA